MVGVCDFVIVLIKSDVCMVVYFVGMLDCQVCYFNGFGKVFEVKVFFDVIFG